MAYIHSHGFIIKQGHVNQGPDAWLFLKHVPGISGRAWAGEIKVLGKHKKGTHCLG